MARSDSLKPVRATRATKRPPVPHAQRLLLLAMLPFPLAIAVTLMMVLAIGNRFPRNIAPNSSLVLPGLLVTLIVLLAILAYVHRRWVEPSAFHFTLVLGGITSLLAWPVWTMGVLPSVNGIRMEPERATMMRLSGLSTTTISKSRRLNYWATLEPAGSTSPLGAGRYLISQSLSERWQAQQVRQVRVTHRTGLLGAEVLITFN